MKAELKSTRIAKLPGDCSFKIREWRRLDTASFVRSFVVGVLWSMMVDGFQRVGIDAEDRVEEYLSFK